MRVMASSLTEVGTRDNEVMKLQKAFDDLSESVKNAYNKIVQLAGFKWPSDLQDMLKNLGTMGEGVLPVVTTTVSALGTLPIGSTGLKAGTDFGGAFKSGVSSALQSLPDLLIKGFTGGGGVGGAIKAFGIQLAQDLVTPALAPVSYTHLRARE